MKSAQGYRRSWRFKIFLFLALVAILFIGAERFLDFGREPSRQHSCEVWITMAQGFKEQIAFKANYSRFSIFSSGSHFVYQNETILAVLIEDHLSNIPINEVGPGV